jgi:ABC-type transporter Mla MlaB component
MFQLPEELIINNIASFHQKLIMLLENNENIEIDITQVAQADTASVQLLCALQKNLLSTEHKIKWHGTSHALSTSAKSLGVLSFLELAL